MAPALCCVVARRQCNVLHPSSVRSVTSGSYGVCLASEGLQTNPHIEQVVKDLQKRLVDHDRDIRKVVQHYFAHQLMQVDFVKWFNRIAPPCLDEFYHDDPEIPPIAEDQIGKSPLVVVRPTCFAWDIGKFSIKYSEETVLDLVPFILVDGFLSHRQAALATQPRELMDPIVSGTVCPW